MKGLVAAIRFMTVLPVGRSGEFDPKTIIPFFPVVGMLIGAATAALDHFLLLAWPVSIVSVLDVLFLVSITGALHVDGLGDTADGLLGHHDRQKALAIMKDSRIGVMGLVAVVFALAIKWAGISNLTADRGLYLVLIPAYARMGMIFGMRFLPYGRAAEGLGHGFFQRAIGVSAFWGCALPLGVSIALGTDALRLIFCFAVITAAVIGYYRLRLGCVTGDMLGALSESLEALLFLLASAGGVA